MTRKVDRERKQRIIVFLFFSIYFIVGMSIYADYGLSTDEKAQHRLGINSHAYIVKGDYSSPLSLRNEDHGPAFQIFLVEIEKLLQLEDSREIFLMRHLVTFLLFFASVYFFYLLCKYHFTDYRIALLGTLFLILSPRIFADSFYNPKDLPFLSVFIVSMYTLIRLSRKRTFLAAAAHAASCALLIDIRITGVVMVIITLFFLGSDLIGVMSEYHKRLRVAKLIFVYICVLIPSIVLLWPHLWYAPAINFVGAFIHMSHYRFGRSVLYLGDRINESKLPWHYISLWLMITTPLLYVFNFFLGLFVFMAGFVRTPFKYLFGEQIQRREMLFFICFFLPLSAVIALKSVLYDGWRHMFFIYPAFLIISLSGMTSLFAFIRDKLNTSSSLCKHLYVGIIVLSVLSVAYSMIKNHPYQNVYFNELVKREGEYLRDNFELDYWGLSYRKALEYILSNDNDEVISIKVGTGPGKISRAILNGADQERLRYVEERDDAKYFLSNQPSPMDNRYHDKEFYSIKVHGSKIMVVYKLK